MVQISRFWDGTTLGDATVAPYDAGTEFSEVMSAIAGASATPNKGGVIKSLVGELSISSPSAGTVRVGVGEAMVYGAWYKSDTNVDHTFATPAAAARTDRIILRKSWATQTVRQMVVVGAEGGSVPTLTQIVGDTWDVPIAQIAVATNGTITITDQRVMLGVPDVSVIFTDPIVRDTLWFGAKPAGVADAQIKRISAGALAAPNEIFTVGIMQADGPIAQERAAKFLTNGVMRWYWGILGGLAENGGNSGGDMGLYRFADDGAYLGPCVGFRRTDGYTAFHNFVGFLNATQWGTSGQRLADEAGTLVWRRQSDSGATMTLDNAGNLNSVGGMQAGGNVTAVAGRLQAGSSAGSYTTIDWNGIITAWASQFITLNPSGAYVIPVNGTVRLGSDGNPFHDITTVQAFRGIGAVATLYGTNNIQLSPQGGYVHPDGAATRSIGHPSLPWQDVWANNHRSTGSVQLLAGGNGDAVVERSGGGSAYIRGGYVFFEGTATLGLVPAAGSGVLRLGDNNHKWIDVWAQNGGIQTSSATVKEGFAALDRGEALNALRLVHFGRFAYKLPKGASERIDPNSAVSRHQIGYLAEDTFRDTGDMFVLCDGMHVTAQQTASTIGAAVQDLDYEMRERIVELEDRIGELETLIRELTNGRKVS
jgi:hypothetical protein